MHVQKLHPGVESSLLSFQALANTVERLPAQTKADARWQAARLRDYTRRLVDEPTLDESLIADVSSSFAEALLDLLPLLSKVPIMKPEIVQASLTAFDPLTDNLEYLSDQLSIEAATWSVRALGMYVERSWAEMAEHETPPQIADNEQEDFVAFISGVEFGGPLRSVILAWALADALERRVCCERALQLSDRFYVETVRAIDEAAMLGMHIDVDAEMSADDRGARALTHLNAARQLMTDEDIKALDDARVHDLR